MNIDEQAAADAIMSARHSDAFNRDACVKILEDNLRGGLGHEPIPVQVFSKPYSPDSRSRKLYGECGICGNRVESEDHDNGHVLQWKHIGTAQPKPEAWQKIADKAVVEFDRYLSNGVPDYYILSGSDKISLKDCILAAIERSHAAQPQRSEQKCERCGGDGWIQDSQGDNNCETCNGTGVVPAPQPEPTDDYCPVHGSDQPPLGERSEHGLLPCPFCGSEAKFGDDGDGGEFITCTNQMCLASSQLKYPHKQDVKPLLSEVWNNRVRPQTSDQPPSSAKTTDDKQEEWTPEHVDKLLGFVSIIGCKRIAAAHNAALAAERQRREQAEQGRAHYRELFEEIRQAVREITPTDATKTEIIDRVKLLVKQLLSALAAIENTKTLLKDISRNAVAQEIIEQLEHYDPSALREHDTEVRKPLVSALEKYMVAMDALYNHNAATCAAVAKYFGTVHPPTAIDALAKVKERK